MGDTSHPQSVTTADLDRWQALADAATEGPWRVEQGTDVVWGACDADDTSTHGMGHPIACGEPPYWAWQQGQPSFAERVRNANLSAEAREALPRLIARVREYERAADIIAGIDQQDGSDDYCRGYNRAIDRVVNILRAARWGEEEASS